MAALPILIKAVKYFAIGAVFALIAPYLGSVIGLAPTPAAASGELGKMGNPLLVGLVFAAIMALDALLKPVFKKIFAEKPPAP